MFLSMMRRNDQETEFKLVYFSFKTRDIINTLQRTGDADLRF